MKLRKWISLAIIGLVLGQPAIAAFEIVTLVNAVETSPSNIILPSSTSGMVSFRPCDEECDAVEYRRARLTDATKFAVNGKAVKFEEFRKAFAAIRGTEDSYALVSYDTKSKTVTSIDVAR